MQIFPFKNSDQITQLLSRTDDKEQTGILIGHFEDLKRQRKPFLLNSNDFEKVLRWKLRGQYGRQERIRKRNTPEIVKVITEAAFRATHSDPDLQAFFRIRILRALGGVEVAVASAILTLCNPKEYAVIDFRIWRQLFQEQKNTFTCADYIRYIHKIRATAEQFDFSLQEIDHAIWQYDIENHIR